MKIQEFVRKNMAIIILTIVGAIGGFLYWRFVGCVSGTCPIKSKWYLMTLWGSAFGYLAGSIVVDSVRNFRNRNSSVSPDQKA
jgi:hypothetical protein